MLSMGGKGFFHGLRIRKDHMKKQVFQGFWHGPPLGEVLQACLASFIQQGYSYDLYTYSPVDVPEGVVQRDAEEIIPYSDIIYFSDPRTGEQDIAPFSDLFRLKLLMERGGWWVDVDTICVSNHIPSARRAWARECPAHHGDLIANGQIAFPIGDPVVTKIYNKALELSRSKLAAREALGSRLMTSVIHECGLPSDMLGTKTRFYPINWIEMFKILLPEFRKEIKNRTEESYFIPIYWSLLKELGINEQIMPPVGSYLFEDGIKKNLKCDYFQSCSRDDVIGSMRDFMNARPWAREQLRAVAGQETGQIFDI